MDTTNQPTSVPTANSPASRNRSRGDPQGVTPLKVIGLAAGLLIALIFVAAPRKKEPQFDGLAEFDRINRQIERDIWRRNMGATGPMSHHEKANRAVLDSFMGSDDE